MSRERGQALIYVLALMLVMAGAAGYFLDRAATEAREANRAEASTRALAIADAGAERAIHALRTAPGPYRGEPATPFASGTYQVEVAPADGGAVEVHAVGRVPFSGLEQGHVERRLLLRVRIDAGVARVLDWREVAR